MSIGKRLLALRQKREMSQEELAQELHVSRQTISKWESDLSLPDMKMIITISEFYHVSITELLGIEEQQDSQESVTHIYEQTKSVLDNIQKENQKRKNRDWIIIGICILSMIIIIGLFWLSYLFPREINRTTKEVIVNEQSQQETEHFINFSLSSFEIKSYDLDKMMITVDYQCTLKEYTKNTKIALVLTDENNQIYTYPMINNQDVFYYQEQIPLVNYKSMKVIIEDENQTKKVDYINGEDRYLTNLIEHAIYLRMERHKNWDLIPNRMEYGISILNNDNIKYQGTLPGELYLKVESLDSNHEVLVEEKVPLGKTTSIELKRDIRNKENIEVSVSAKINGIQYYEETVEKQILYGSMGYEIISN